ncbi:MAG: Coat domain protein [Anaerospora sp.]|nr:Coat domain protein [Anaerospora sp.]
MSLQFTEKEMQLLQDQQSHEKVCIEKYQKYASQASDPQLKQLFQSYAQQEQQHLNTMLCKDMLMTEKYVSGAYDTAIFEFTDTNIRQALNHIQKEEQKHGEGLFNYMSSNGMYNVQ